MQSGQRDKQALWGRLGLGGKRGLWARTDLGETPDLEGTKAVQENKANLVRSGNRVLQAAW